MTTRTGKAYRSKTWIRLYPRKATASCATTTISRHSTSGRWVSALSASAPLTLFTANQPMPATRALIPAGMMLPQKPNPRRLSTICGTPYVGPLVDRMPWVMEPSVVPIKIARNVAQKLRPKKTTPMKPTKTVANSMFGEVQVQKSCSGRPWRSLSGMNSAPLARRR